jgi:DNA repair protein SbcC/Rad50
LEAIELFYCGRNKRSPNAKPRYDLRATFDDGSQERVTDDAAVRLADEAIKIDEELSKLLIGPDAAKTWENMLKVHDQVKLQLKNLREEERSLQRQLADVDSLVATLTDRASSDLVRPRLLNMLRQQNWRAPTSDDADDLAANLIGPLSELVALARQASGLPLSPTPSRSALVRLTKSLNASRDKVIADIDTLAGLERQIDIATTFIERAREASTILQRVSRFVAAGGLDTYC